MQFLASANWWSGESIAALTDTRRSGQQVSTPNHTLEPECCSSPGQPSCQLEQTAEKGDVASITMLRAPGGQGRCRRNPALDACSVRPATDPKGGSPDRRHTVAEADGARKEYLCPLTESRYQFDTGLPRSLCRQCVRNQAVVRCSLCERLICDDCA